MSDTFWTSAAPLWAETNSSDLSDIKRPTILRFARDSFMDEFAQVLAAQPARLGDYLAQPETWRDPLPPPVAVLVLPERLRLLQRRLLGNGSLQQPVQIASGAGGASKDPRPLKLYQPAHQRFYLLTSSLVCRQVGLPDHAINTSAQERTTFVVRRLMLADPQRFGPGNPPPAPDKAPTGVYNEYAFVDGVWQRTTDGNVLLAGEEQNPLFAVCYTQTDGRRRRLFGGLIPVGKREAYMGAKSGTQAAPASTADPRLDMLLRRVFFGPWERLIESANDAVLKMTQDRVQTDDPGETKKKQKDEIIKKRLQIQESSWYLLLDLANFLSEHMKPVLDALEQGTTPASGPAKQVVDALNNIVLPEKMKKLIKKAYGVDPEESLGKALGKILANGEPFDENITEPYNGSGLGSVWPNFLFPLVDMVTFSATEDEWPNGPWTPALNFPRRSSDDGANPGRSLDELREKLLAALPVQGPQRLPPIPLAAQTPAAIGETGWFVARCVLERPNCLPLPDAILSDPTPPFQLAGFFDPDAPARPIRIALPVDTTPAGLRKFDKNTAFMISDVLCGQVSRAQSLGLGDLIRSVLPWPLHKDLNVDTAPCAEDGGGVTFGMICSLSIPIITICALILLMSIVSLLDIIFRWIPYFIFCFPLPGFTAKKANP